MKLGNSGAALLMLLTGCGSTGSLVLVDVGATATLSAVARLHVTATIGGSSPAASEFDVPLKNGPASIPPVRSFAIDVSSKYSGTITVKVDAYDASSNLLASAVADGTLSAGHEVTLSVVLGSTAAVDGGADLQRVDLVQPDLLPSYTLSIAPSAQPFALTAEGTDGASASFTVTASTPVAANLPAAKLGGSGAGSFVITDDGCGGAPLPSGSCTVSVKFHPIAAGVITATLSVANASAALNGTSSGTWSVATPTGAGASENFTGVWATPGSTSVWLTSNPTSTTGSVWHRDGSGTWSEPKDADATTQYNAVWGTSDTDLWVVGVSTVGSQAPLAYHRGASGTFTLSGNGINVSDTGAINALSGIATGDVWAAQSSYGTDACIHWTGATWASDSTPSVAMTALWIDPTTHAGFAVGTRTDAPDFFNEIYRRSTSGTWATPISTDNGTTYNSVWGASANVGYVGGSAGLIYVTDGTTFTAASPPPTTQTIDGLWGSSANDIFAVGSAGAILHSTGSNVWTAQTSGTSAQLNAVYGTSSGDVWVVGEGIVLHYQ